MGAFQNFPFFFSCQLRLGLGLGLTFFLTDVVSVHSQFCPFIIPFILKSMCNSFYRVQMIDFVISCRSLNSYGRWINYSITYYMEGLCDNAIRSELEIVA